MDFSLTEDRRMLQDSLTRYLTEQYPVEHRNKIAYDLPCQDPEKWAEMAELGALFALAPEDAGGFGGTGFDINVVFEALGTTLNPEPVLGALMASRLMTSAGADQEALLAGTTKYAFAVSEIEAPYDAEYIETTAAAAGDGYTLTGRKTSVYGGQVADIFLVAAKLNGKLAVFEVAASDANVVGYPMMDGGGAAEVLMDGTPGKLLIEDAAEAIQDAVIAGIVALCAEAVGAMTVTHATTVDYLKQRKQFGVPIGKFQVLMDGTPGKLLIEDAADAIQDAVNAGIVALCAEAVGAMTVTHATTVDYLKQRKQFGVPIGKFQVLQHRAVDMLTEIEQARSITIKAAAELGGPDASRYASMAKNMIGRAGRLIAEEAIQMHGGIAMTWEYPISHYAKRLIMLDAQLGDTDHHLTRIMADLKAA